jgi:hypothetical protein
MTPPTTNSTSVDVKFYTSGSTSNYPDVSATLIDNRNVFHIYANHNISTTKMFLQIDSGEKTSNALTTIEIHPGKMTIGATGSNESDICDATYNFQPRDPSTHTTGNYSLKIYIVNANTTYYGKFGWGSVLNQVYYNFYYRSSNLDHFDPSSSVTNISQVEKGQTIEIYCPLVINDNDDSRRPHTVRFMFDEKDDYAAPNNRPANSDALQSWSASVPYNTNENNSQPNYAKYTLTTVGLENDSWYQVSVVALYDDGHVVSHTLENMLPVIAKPVISKVVAYGLGLDTTGPGDSSLATVMEVYMKAGTAANKIGLANNQLDSSKRNKILFSLKKNGTTYYTVRKSISQVTSTVNGVDTFQYIINRNEIDNLVSNPQANSNNTYTLDVDAELEYLNPNDQSESGNIKKTSDAVAATFAHDIIPLQSFTIENAWVSAAVTTVSGTRMVDLTNSISSQGYGVAPECGIVGSFKKNAFYGSGIQTGLFKDLDIATTKHKFQLTKYDANGNAIPNSTVNVTKLVQMQGSVASPTATQTQQEFVDLVNQGGIGINVQGNLTSVLTNAQMGLNDNIAGNSNRGIFADSNRGIVTVESNMDGITIKNTGPNTNGVTNGTIPKINAYYYTNPSFATNITSGAQNSSNSFSLNDAIGLKVYAVFHQNAGAKQYPFFILYTSRTSSENVGSWYKSRINYGPQSYEGMSPQYVDPDKVGLTLIYTGTDDGSFMPEIPSKRRIQYEVKLNGPNSDQLTGSYTNANAGYASELMGTLSLHTSSNASEISAGDFDFRLLEAGMVTSHVNFDKISMTFNKKPLASVISAESSSGLYDNIPGAAGVLGPNQPPIYFWIPFSSGLYSQSDNVKVSIQIVSLGATIPEATFSTNSSVVINKVNRYEMTFGADSEPTFLESTGVLTVPINNPKTLSNEYHLSSATFTSNLTSTGHNSVTKAQENDGVFKVTLLNPSPRGVSNPCDYRVHYTIADPKGSNIRGPLSAQYRINIKDHPTTSSYTVSNYSYTTFHNNNVSGGISSFTFDIAFIDHQTKGIDGVNVYFESASDFVLFHLKDVKRNTLLSSQTVSYTLQNTAPLTNAVNDGVKIIGSDGVVSTATWRNYGAGKIVIEPYITEKVDSNHDTQTKIPDQSVRKDINNIPVISKVENIVLNGGVLELHDGTSMSFDKALPKYSGVSNVTASYVLSLNTQDQSNNIVSNDSLTDKYVIGLGSSPSNYALNLKVKLVTSNDGSSYESESAVLVFDSVSVDVLSMNVNVRRNSNSSSLSVVRGDYTVSPSGASYLNVTEVKLVDNLSDSNTNPLDSGVYVLPCTNSVVSDIQPLGSVGSPNTYSLVRAGVYELSYMLRLQYRVKAGVDYTLQYSSQGSASYHDSRPNYVSLKPSTATNATKYVIATRPEVTIVSSFIESSKLKLKMKIDAKGLKNEGVQSVVLLLGQDGDYPDANDVSNGEGAQIVLSFTSANVSETYDLTTSGNLSNNINNGGEATLTTVDVNGLNEGSGLSATWKLKAGSLDNSDESVLTFPDLSSGTYGGFVSGKPISVVAALSTRLGIDLDIKTCPALP